MIDRPLVAVRLPNGPEWVASVESVWASGGAVLPLSPDQPEAMTAAALRTLRPARVLDPGGRETPLGDAQPVPDGTAVVIATSGSTATPKGVMLSHAALEASARASLRRLGAGKGDHWLCCLPLHHVAGLQVLTRSRLLGNEPVIHGRFDAARVAAQRDVTMVAVVPTMLRRLLEHDLSHLRCVLLGGAAAGAGLLADAAAAGVPVVTTYGMTETAGGCVYDGRPLDGVEVAVDASSRIRLRGPMLFSGYRGDPERTAQAVDDGWLVTEDLGRLTPDGRLEVLGRADDVIITGGENVPAGFVAELLERHPAVAEAAVVGRPDPEWGQRVVAVIVAQGAAPTLADVRAFLATRAPAHAAPRELVVVDALPRLGSGKVDRLAVRALLA